MLLDLILSPVGDLLNYQRRVWRKIKRTIIVTRPLSGGGTILQPSNFGRFIRPKGWQKRRPLQRGLIRSAWRQRFILPPPPSSLSWKRFKAPKLHSRPLSRFFRAKHITFLPALPSFLSWRRFKAPKLHSRPLGRFFRPKHIALLVLPSGLFWKKLRAPKLHSRPLARFFRPKHIFIIPALPSSLSWKRFKAPRLHSRPLLRFFRPKHIIFAPVQPSSLSWKKPLRPKIKRWRWSVLGRARLRYVIAPQPSSLSWKRFKAPRLHSRPLFRFFRPVNVYPFSSIFSVVSKPQRHFRIKRTSIVQRILSGGGLTTPQVSPFVIPWKKAKPPRLHSRPLSRFFRPKTTTKYIVPAPRSFLSWKRFKSSRLHSRPLLRFFNAKNRPGRTYPFQFQQQGFVGNASRYFRPRFIRRWRLRSVYPIFSQAAPPASLVWKQALRVRVKRSRPLSRFFRPKHLTFIPVQPSSLSWKRFKAPKLHSRPWGKFFRPKHTSLITSQTPSALIVWKRLRSPRPHSRPLSRFFRAKHIAFLPALPSFLTWKRFKGPKLHSRPLSRFFRPKRVTYLPPLPPPPPPVVIPPAGGGHRKRKPIRPVWDIAKYGSGEAVAQPLAVQTLPPSPATTILHQRPPIDAVMEEFKRELALMGLRLELQSVRSALAAGVAAPVTQKAEPSQPPLKVSTGTALISGGRTSLSATSTASVKGTFGAVLRPDSVVASAAVDDDDLVMHAMDADDEDETKAIVAFLAEIHKAGLVNEILNHPEFKQMKAMAEELATHQSIH